MFIFLLITAIGFFGPPVLVLVALCGDTRLGLWYGKNPWPKALILALIPGFVRMALAMFLFLLMESRLIFPELMILMLLPEYIAVSSFFPPGTLSKELEPPFFFAFAFLFGFIFSLALLSIRNAFLKNGEQR